jgi:hypothetical protein
MTAKLVLKLLFQLKYVAAGAIASKPALLFIALPQQKYSSVISKAT